MEPNPPSVSSAGKSKLTLSLDLRWVALALVAVIVAMLLVWQPWSQVDSVNARTVTVTGDTTVKAVPDEYVFSLSYQNTNADKAVAIQKAGATSAEIIAKLKALGVTDKQIKTRVDGYGNAQPDYMGIGRPVPVPSDGGYVYTLQLTVTLTDRAKTQQVQDYLVTTNPTGTVTPMPTFSDGLRKQLESKARDAATREARTKADQSARNLGFKVGSVKSVDDGGGIRPMMGGVSSSEAKDSAPSFSVQPGENDLNYSVTVTYYIK